MSRDYTRLGYYLESLQDQLDRFRRQGNWLVLSWLVWILLAMIGVLVQLNAFNIVLTGIILVAFCLIVYFTMQHDRLGTTLEDEVRRLPYRQLSGDLDAMKSKRDDPDIDYAIGADGELFEVSPDDAVDSDHHKLSNG